MGLSDAINVVLLGLRFTLAQPIADHGHEK
jgi:hypothetical protein